MDLIPDRYPVDLYWYLARVVRIIDGDTIEVTLDHGFELYRDKVRVRLFGIDAPELTRSTERWRDLTMSEREKIAYKARDRVALLAADGTNVLLRTYKDRNGGFGRPAAYVYVNELMVVEDWREEMGVVRWHGENWYNVGDYLLAKKLARPYP